MKEEKTKKIIFVCTGNTCRSPMAEALFRSELKRLRIADVEVSSAGLAVAKNDGLNPYSAMTLSENGLSLENFRSTQLTEELIQDAYAVVCMTEKQRLAIEEKLALAFFASAGKRSFAQDKIHSFYTLVGYDVPDPFGRELDCYRFVFQKIADGMERICQKLQLVSMQKTDENDGVKQTAPPKKRGRPKKNPQATSEKVPIVPKKRGRPRKNPEQSESGKQSTNNG